MTFQKIFRIFDINKYMQKFVKYKRFELKTFDEFQNLQQFFDDLIKEGWEIIHYSETDVTPSVSPMGILIVIVAGKRHTAL